MFVFYSILVLSRNLPKYNTQLEKYQKRMKKILGDKTRPRFDPGILLYFLIKLYLHNLHIYIYVYIYTIHICTLVATHSVRNFDKWRITFVRQQQIYDCRHDKEQMILIAFFLVLKKDINYKFQSNIKSGGWQLN